MTSFVMITAFSGLVGQMRYLLERQQTSASVFEDRLDKIPLFKFVLCSKLPRFDDNLIFDLRLRGGKFQLLEACISDENKTMPKLEDYFEKFAHSL